MAAFVDVERGLSSLGRWSKWHLVMYILSSATYYYASMHMLAIVFVGMNPETFQCKVPDGVTPADAIPPGEKGGLDHCSHYENFTFNATVVKGCPLGWEYSNEVYSMIHEWDTVCDRAYMISTSQTILVVGVMIGAMTMATLSDYVGRKRVMLWSVIVISILGFCVGWVKHFWLFCLLRFLIGVVQQGIILAGFIYACELFPMADRTVAGLLMQLHWGIGMFFLVFFAYFVRQWDNLMIAISVPGVLVIPLFWILPESIPYLVAKGRLREAKEILQAAAKMNNVQLPPEFDLSPEDEKLLNAGVTDIPEPAPAAPGRRRSSVVDAVYAARRSSVGVAVRRMSRAPLPPDGEIHNYTCIDILKSRKLLIFSLIMAFLWCTSALVYYGLALNTGSLAGDPYLNFFLGALVELPAAIIGAFLLQVIGRRYPLAAFHLIAGIPLFILLGIPVTTSGGTDLKPLIITLAMVGKFGITACFAAVFMFAPELLPTTIRGAGLGIASVGARVGNLIAPFTALVADLVWWLPNVVFAAMCILAAILTLLLPETLGRPLPRTIREVEQWTRTLTPEEKAKFEAYKKKDKDDRKKMKLAVLAEEEEPEENA